MKINKLTFGTFIAYILTLTRNERRLKMSTKKIIALTGAILVLAAGLALAQEKKGDEANKVQVKNQAQTQSANQLQTQAQARARTRVRTQFIDQNGDGINDLYRDADNDGIPNCQDPDWTRPLDGTGYKGGKGTGQANAAIQAGNGKGFLGNQGFFNQSFRNAQPGSGICCPGCDGTGPKGKINRKGRG
jgi:hypothetical protein